jgi:hypothetical protein
MKSRLLRLVEALLSVKKYAKIQSVKISKKDPSIITIKLKAVSLKPRR